jgi:hypothetical protein
MSMSVGVERTVSSGRYRLFQTEDSKTGSANTKHKT